MNKDKDFYAIMLSAALISRIQRKYYIKFEFYDNITILMEIARKNITLIDVSSLHYVSQIFKNLDLNYIQKLFIDYNQIIINHIIKSLPELNFFVKYIDFLCTLTKETLSTIKKELNLLLNKIDSEKLHSIQVEYRNYNINLLILMSKADLLNQNLFNNIFENFFDKISPIRKNFLEEIMNLIKKFPEKEKLDYLNKVRIIFKIRLKVIIKTILNKEI